MLRRDYTDQPVGRLIPIYTKLRDATLAGPVPSRPTPAARGVLAYPRLAALLFWPSLVSRREQVAECNWVNACRIQPIRLTEPD